MPSKGIRLQRNHSFFLLFVRDYRKNITKVLFLKYPWHSGARQSSHPSSRPPQSRQKSNLALGGSRKQPPLESSSAIAAKKATLHSGARLSSHPSSRPPQSRQKSHLALGGSPKQPPPESSSAI